MLGIDPGTARLGWGVVDSSAGRLRALDAGALRTSPETPLSRRLLALHDGVAELIARHQPDAVAVEKLYTGRNVTTAIPVGQARGAVLVAAARAGLDVLEFSPHEVKQAVTGYGRADKVQVQAMIRALLGLAEPPRPDDVADALAVAICGAHAQGLRRALAGR